MFTLRSLDENCLCRNDDLISCSSDVAGDWPGSGEHMRKYGLGRWRQAKGGGQELDSTRKYDRRREQERVRSIAHRKAGLLIVVSAFSEVALSTKTTMRFANDVLVLSATPVKGEYRGQRREHEDWWKVEVLRGDHTNKCACGQVMAPRGQEIQSYVSVTDTCDIPAMPIYGVSPSDQEGRCSSCGQTPYALAPTYLWKGTLRRCDRSRLLRRCHCRQAKLLAAAHDLQDTLACDQSAFE
ncbi:hypothetical protein PR048_017666 [Dryococelus australis]|uniref:Uncharacterized protein n=1 Tax=Dryococelus australis TaxID=614101 RepID=A0ABQ9HA78_9NEOP|nr:hypothetical protein PR048_017666 [Dryococelus australis]